MLQKSLWYKGVATFSSGDGTADCSIQLSVNLQEITFCIMVSNTASKRVFGMAGHVLNRRVNKGVNQ